MIAPTQQSVHKKVFLKIGRPGYRVTKVRDRDTGKEGMMVQVHLPQIKPGVIPRRRFMSAWEQKREPPNKAYQYLIVSVHRSLITFRDAHSLFRSPLNPMKLLPSVFPHEKSRMSRMTLAIGTGRTGTPIPSSIVSSSCSVSSTDCTLPPAHICIHVNAMQPMRLWQPQYILCLHLNVRISRVRFLRLSDHVHCMNAFQ